MGKQASHKILFFGVTIHSQKPLLNNIKHFLLKAGLRDLQRKGRVVLDAKFYERFEADARWYHGGWSFETIYLGRRAVLNKVLVHVLRKAYHDAMKDPIRWRAESK